MKKTKYDLSIIEHGLETQTFFFGDVISLFYNSCSSHWVSLQTETGHFHYRYDWVQTNFDAIPMATRKQLIRILFRQEEFESGDRDFFDEFYNRIYCTLRTLLDEETVYKEHNGELMYDRYYCSFEDLISPVTVMKEFLMWHQMGLPISSEEKILLEKCLQKFLPDLPSEKNKSKKALKQKQNDLRRKIHNLNRKCRRLDAILRQIDDSAEDEDENMKERELVRKLLNISSDKFEIQAHLALAEAFPILYGSFPQAEEATE
ncbi:MAG: hypothetical protein IJ770_01555 [Alphaproteobacteria bacterium]|nr:hypothetical protein [Alphaproteobacteria bacterium]